VLPVGEFAMSAEQLVELIERYRSYPRQRAGLAYPDRGPLPAGRSERG
jgi:hypothetical protein